MIDLTIHDEAVLERAVQKARESNIIIPTFKQQYDPQLIPDVIKRKLADVGLWDLNPLNLFRITWHNDQVPSGGGFGGVDFLEIPRELTGINARIYTLVGKWFPTGAHKVGAAFGCLVPRLVTGQFDPTSQKAVWPSTGNYCRGGAYDSHLLGCESIAILPEGMSKERFDWLATVAGETIKTPGSESNVKEIFDKCWELRASGEDLVIFNQFEEFGNYLWHYEITGRAMMEVLNQVMGPNDSYRGVALTTGSAGTIACGDYLKDQFPTSKIAASEALQCPTLLNNGFGSHRIEGIGDKHVPWIHNVRNTDMVMAIDDAASMGLLRLFNEEAGQDYLEQKGVPLDFIEKLPELGISMEMYQSRILELREEEGPFTTLDAAAAYGQYMAGVTTDHLQELTYNDRKRVHNLKYYTWVEQQGKTYEEIQAQWYDANYWTNIHGHVDEMDTLIDQFNERTGLLAEML
jgi:cysteine synthase